MSNEIRDVWHWSVREELMALDQSLSTTRLLVVDTEFPGFLHESNLTRSGFLPYSTLKSNVDPTNLIQLGISLLSPHGLVLSTWSINFRFDLDRDVHSPSGIEFLKSNGHDFQKSKDHSVDFFEFSRAFRSILAAHRGLTWVTFHGLYDVAYLIKMITGRVLPDTGSGFVALAGYVLGSVIDLKYVYQFCNHSGRANLGLEKLANIPVVSRTGGAHEAGSDCLLTARVYVEMKCRFRFEDARFQGFLYGVDSRIPNTRAVQVWQPVFVPVYPQPPPARSHCCVPVYTVARIRDHPSSIQAVGPPVL